MSPSDSSSHGVDRRRIRGKRRTRLPTVLCPGHNEPLDPLDAFPGTAEHRSNSQLGARITKLLYRLFLPLLQKYLAGYSDQWQPVWRLPTDLGTALCLRGDNPFGLQPDYWDEHRVMRSFLAHPAMQQDHSLVK